MSYQALARKWRPQSFEEVIGQDHVVSALANALDSERVHHAYLFTGTRGVGKTTLARIFARALNCENGVSASPCGQCNACVGVTQGNYIDLIEVDAASRTRVDDTRELLDNVQYAPTLGRYKIYLIDEVHMLSTHSFNALLKTLEEPPEHVKFLLATTDPQKLPATILSRCIQFNLKAMDIERLYGQLEKILTAEIMPFESEALKVIARSADGSVRDALSLLDQAIAFGKGQVQTDQVRSMLGMIDREFTRQLLLDICANNPTSVMQTVSALAERSVDFVSAMDDILTTLHHIALQHVAPEAVVAKGVDTERVEALAALCDPELTQLLYQIALIGKRDLPMAPDPRTGFEMALLRMTSFQPQSVSITNPSAESRAETSQLTGSSHAQSSSTDSRASSSSRIQRDPAVVKSQSGTTTLTDSSGQANTEQKETQSSKVSRRKFIERPQSVSLSSDTSKAAATLSAVEPSPAIDLPIDNPPAMAEIPPEFLEQTIPQDPASPAVFDCAGLKTMQGWTSYAETSGLDGIAKELAMNMVPREEVDGVLTLVLDERSQHLFNEARVKKINQHLSAISGGTAPAISVSIESIENEDMETPSLQKQRIVAETQQAAEQTFREDPNVQELVNLFDAEIIEDSVRPAVD